MNRLLPLFIISIVITSSASLDAQEYAPLRWKETGRLNENQQAVPYTDTVFLNTEDREVMDLVIGGYAYRGKVKNDSLDIKKRIFLVLSNTPEEIRLKFDKLSHIFTRELKGTIGADAPEFAAQNKIPEVALKKVNTKLLTGNWLVYKKTLREGFSIDIKQAQYIKKLEFFKQTRKGYRGILTTATNLTMKVRSLKGSDIKYRNTFNVVMTLKVLRQNAGELLLEDEQHMVYFLKKY